MKEKPESSWKLLYNPHFNSLVHVVQYGISDNDQNLEKATKGISSAQAELSTYLLSEDKPLSCLPV